MDTATALLKFRDDYMLQEKAWSPRTVQQYMQCLYMMQEKMDLMTATRHCEVNRVVLQIARERPGRNSEFWSQGTLRRLADVCVVFYRWCLREQIMDFNPYPCHEIEKGTPDEAEWFDYEHPEDRAKLDRLIYGPDITERDSMMCLTFMMTGVRRQELADMQMGHIDCGQRFVKVRGKGQKVRVIPLEASFARRLDFYVQHMRRCSRVPYVFPRNDFLGPLTGSGIGKYFIRMSKRVGFHVHPHMFRHSWISFMLSKGIRPDIVKRLAGHSNVSTTLDIYAHTKDETNRDCIDDVFATFPAAVTA